MYGGAQLGKLTLPGPMALVDLASDQQEDDKQQEERQKQRPGVDTDVDLHHLGTLR